MEVHLRVIRDKKSVLVTICDPGLLGATFRQDKLRLDVSADFYGGPLCAIEKAMQALADADVGNLVGEGTIKAAIDRGLVDPDAVVYFDRVPHVQVVRL